MASKNEGSGRTKTPSFKTSILGGQMENCKTMDLSWTLTGVGCEPSGTFVLVSFESTTRLAETTI